jgi:hypothetical protein
MDAIDDPIVQDFMHGETYNTSPIARHLMLCESLRHAPGTTRAVTCDHDFWWGLTMTEQSYLNNKI